MLSSVSLLMKMLPLDNSSLKNNKYLTPEGTEACEKFIHSLYACRDLLEIAFGEHTAIFITQNSYQVLHYCEHN